MPPSPAPLTAPQVIALAKVACGIEDGAGAVVLGGPPGVGKTTVLEHLVNEMQLTGRTCMIRDVAGWLAEHDLPDVVMADDAHTAGEADLARLVTRCQARSPAAALVLAGQGRLLTLVARDLRVERAIRLRATLLPGSLADTASLLTREGGPRFDEHSITAIHEVTAGMPADVVRLRELAAIITTDNGHVTAHDVEAIHSRLAPIAA